MGDVAVLLLGLVALASATRYALRPERLCLRFVAILWLTLLVVIVDATITDVAAVFHYLEDPLRAPAPKWRASWLAASRNRRGQGPWVASS